MAENPHEDLPVPKSASPERAADELPDPESLVEVYRTDNEMAALFVRDEILAPVGIFTALHNRRSGSIVAPASMSGSIGVAVPGDQADSARSRLRVAKTDGVLLDGELIEESVA
jgi:hypothetical protein